MIEGLAEEIVRRVYALSDDPNEWLYMTADITHRYPGENINKMIVEVLLTTLKSKKIILPPLLHYLQVLLSHNYVDWMVFVEVYTAHYPYPVFISPHLLDCLLYLCQQLHKDHIAKDIVLAALDADPSIRARQTDLIVALLRTLVGSLGEKGREVGMSGMEGTALGLYEDNIRKRSSEIVVQFVRAPVIQFMCFPTAIQTTCLTLFTHLESYPILREVCISDLQVSQYTAPNLRKRYFAVHLQQSEFDSYRMIVPYLVCHVTNHLHLSLSTLHAKVASIHRLFLVPVVHIIGMAVVACVGRLSKVGAKDMQCLYALFLYELLPTYISTYHPNLPLAEMTQFAAFHTHPDHHPCIEHWYAHYSAGTGVEPSPTYAALSLEVAGPSLQNALQDRILAHDWKGLRAPVLLFALQFLGRLEEVLALVIKDVKTEAGFLLFLAILECSKCRLNRVQYERIAAVVGKSKSAAAKTFFHDYTYQGYVMNGTKVDVGAIWRDRKKLQQLKVWDAVQISFDLVDCMVAHIHEKGGTIDDSDMKHLLGMHLPFRVSIVHAVCHMLVRGEDIIQREIHLQILLKLIPSFEPPDMVDGCIIPTMLACQKCTTHQLLPVLQWHIEEDSWTPSICLPQSLPLHTYREVLVGVGKNLSQLGTLYAAMEVHGRHASALAQAVVDCCIEGDVEATERIATAIAILSPHLVPYICRLLSWAQRRCRERQVALGTLAWLYSTLFMMAPEDVALECSTVIAPFLRTGTGILHSLLLAFSSAHCPFWVGSGGILAQLARNLARRRGGIDLWLCIVQATGTVP